MSLEFQSMEHSPASESVFMANGSYTDSDTVYARPPKTVFSRVPNPSRLFRYRVLKRTLDVLLVITFSPLLLLVFAVVAAAIRIDSRGPIFFSHRRVGQSGGFFTMLKFRTMCENSTEALHQYLKTHPEAAIEWRKNHKLKNDPRITRMGRFLRSTSLDELPQILNVLNGTMSLVGPRPIVADEVDKFGDSITEYCMVMPGITGLWQTSGRSNTTYAERVQLDRTYVHSWCLASDLKILAKTPMCVFCKHGAY